MESMPTPERNSSGPPEKRRVLKQPEQSSETAIPISGLPDGNSLRCDLINSKEDDAAAKIPTKYFAAIRKKTRSVILSVATCKVTTEKLRNADFSDRPKDKLRVLAVASRMTLFPLFKKILSILFGLKEIQLLKFSHLTSKI